MISLLFGSFQHGEYHYCKEPNVNFAAAKEAALKALHSCPLGFIQRFMIHQPLIPFHDRLSERPHWEGSCLGGEETAYKSMSTRIAIEVLVN
jgi:hypothetical protein